MRRRSDAQALKSFTPLSFLSSRLSSLHTFLPVDNLSRVFYFYRLITINHNLHLRSTQTLCLHLSRSTLMRKTLTIDNYLGIQYFQQSAAVICRPLQFPSFFPPSLVVPPRRAVVGCPPAALPYTQPSFTTPHSFMIPSTVL